MKTKSYYDSLPADSTLGLRIPLELREDFKKLFPRHGDHSRAIRDWLTDTVVQANKDNNE